MAAGYPRSPVDHHEEAEVPDLQQGTIARVKAVENGEGLDNGNRIYLANVAFGNLVYGPMPEVCAVKQMPRAGQYGRQNWNEVFTLMQIQEEGLAAVLHALAVFKDTHYLYIVMPWCRGGDLFKRACAFAGDEGALREWTIHLFRPLAELHNSGWAHGDLALENYLVAGDGTLKIIDCAQMRQVHAPGEPQNEVLIPWDTQTGRAEFTPPERWRPPASGMRSAKKGDVYQLGCILFAPLKRGYPFKWPHEVLLPRRELPKTGGCCKASVEKLLQCRPDASPLLQDFLGRLLAPDPDRRLSAEEALAHEWVTRRTSDSAGQAAEVQTPRPRARAAVEQTPEAVWSSAGASSAAAAAPAAVPAPADSKEDLPVDGRKGMHKGKKKGKGKGKHKGRGSAPT